jgi:hypothetical protein
MKYLVNISYTNPAHEHVSLRRRVDTINRVVEARSEEEALNRVANQQRALGFLVRDAKVIEEAVSFGRSGGVMHYDPKTEKSEKPAKGVSALDKDGNLVGHYKDLETAKKNKPGHTYQTSKGVAKEEVEQTDEAIRGYIQSEPGNQDGTSIRRPANQAERDQLAKNLIANRKYNLGKKIGRKSGSVRSNAAGMTPSQKISTALRSPEASKKLDPKEFSYMPKNAKITPFLSKEEVEQVDEKAPPGAKYERMVKHIKAGYAKGGLTDKERSIAYATAWKAHNKANEEAEGTVAVTPKEKALAAHHGDKTKITYGDVIKARLKSAAAKKMGK